MSYSYLQQAVDVSNASAYTFTAQNLGIVNAGRYIVVAIASRKAGATTTITSATIGGVAATIVVQNSSTVTNTSVTGLVIASVPSGANGDVVINFGATMVRCGIALYRLDRLPSASAYDNQTSTADDPAVSLNVPDHGCAIGIATTNGAALATWTGLTKDFDVTMEATNQYSGASKKFVMARSALSIIANWNAGVESSGSFASWQFDQPSEFFAFM